MYIKVIKKLVSQKISKSLKISQKTFKKKQKKFTIYLLNLGGLNSISGELKNLLNNNICIFFPSLSIM